MTGNRAPLALMYINLHREWRSFQTADQVRGVAAEAVRFLRRPTLQERRTVEACLAHKPESTIPRLSQCKTCGCLWRENPPSAGLPEGSYSLAFASQNPEQCCDNAEDPPIAPVILVTWDAPANSAP